MNITKQCTKCGIPKLIDDFYIVKGFADGHRNCCKECFSNHGKQWRKSNVDKVKDCKKRYDAANPGKRREWKRAWDRKRMLDPLHRLSNNLRGGIYHALKGKKGFRKWETLVGYTLEDLIKHLTPLLIAGMSWDNYGNTWQVDHVKPKSWFTYISTDDPSFKECWALSNLQPKFKLDNIRKGNRFEG